MRSKPSKRPKCRPKHRYMSAWWFITWTKNNPQLDGFGMSQSLHIDSFVIQNEGIYQPWHVQGEAASVEATSVLRTKILEKKRVAMAIVTMPFMAGGMRFLSAGFLACWKGNSWLLLRNFWHFFVGSKQQEFSRWVSCVFSMSVGRVSTGGDVVLEGAENEAPSPPVRDSRVKGSRWRGHM